MVSGGWDSSDGKGTAVARQFSMELNKKNAGWIYGKGEPFKIIATRELLAALFSLVLLVPAGSGAFAGTARLVGLTDNQGNIYLLSKMMTSRFPLCVILMGLAVQMELRGVFLHGEWTPRDQNVEADALTNGHFQTSTCNSGCT